MSGAEDWGLAVIRMYLGNISQLFLDATCCVFITDIVHPISASSSVGVLQRLLCYIVNLLSCLLNFFAWLSCYIVALLFCYIVKSFVKGNSMSVILNTKDNFEKAKECGLLK